MIKIDFEMTNGTHTYRDALYLDDNHTLSDAEIEAIKQSRFDRWLSIITNPQVIETPSEEPVVDVVPEQGV